MNGYIYLSKYPYLYFPAYLVNWCGGGGSKVHNSTWIRLLFPSFLVVGVAIRDVLEGGEGRRESIHCRV